MDLLPIAVIIILIFFATREPRGGEPMNYHDDDDW